MRVTINGKVSKDALGTILNEQKEKIKEIELFCKTNKISILDYKDNELDFHYEIEKTIKNKEVEKR